jgi:hypothetical protein
MMGGAPPRADSERRIVELERSLKQLSQQVSQLAAQLKDLRKEGTRESRP